MRFVKSLFSCAEDQWLLKWLSPGQSEGQVFALAKMNAQDEREGIAAQREGLLRRNSAQVTKKPRASVLSKIEGLARRASLLTGIFLTMTAMNVYAQNNPFGVLEFLHWDHPWNSNKYHTQEDLDKAADAVRRCGAGIVRVDFLWQDIEPQRGKYDFAKYDRIVEALTSRGIEILGILDYSADWASACGKWNCPPKDFDIFAAYAAKVAGRYRGKVKYWEIWNEPDSAVYWQPQDRLKSYCRLLEVSYKAVKKADPGCLVLNGGLANGLSSVNVLYENGAAPYFDILNVHIFESPLSDGALSRIRAFPRLVRKKMLRNGDGSKKIWITETGCPGAAGRSVKGWWLGKNPGEQEQAEWVLAVYAELTKAEGVEKIFWAFLRDCNRHWKNGTDYLGLLRWDFSEKPAFGAYTRARRQWEEEKRR